MKKKILILTTAGGMGHIAATKALTDYLSNEYDITSVKVFTTILQPIDWLEKVSAGNYTGVDCYNYFEKKKWFKLLNLMYKACLVYFKIRKTSIQKIFDEYIKKEKPDLVISVTTIINDFVLQAAKKESIPFVIIPTDFDATTFIVGLDKPNYDKFKMLISFNDPEILKTLEPAHIDPKYIEFTGFPVRPEFLQKQHDSKTIKRKFDLPVNKPIVMVLMGGHGSNALYSFAQQFEFIAMPIHVIFCVGSSDHLIEKIEQIPFPAHVTVSIYGYCDHIAHFMTVSDLLITKSGSVSVAEAIYRELPMLLDATSTVLRWEQFNHRFIKRHHFGSSIYHINDIPEIITGLLFHTDRFKHIRKNLQNFEKKDPGIEIPQAIKKMLK